MCEIVQQNKACNAFGTQGRTCMLCGFGAVGKLAQPGGFSAAMMHQTPWDMHMVICWQVCQAKREGCHCQCFDWFHREGLRTDIGLHVATAMETHRQSAAL